MIVVWKCQASYFRFYLLESRANARFTDMLTKYEGVAMGVDQGIYLTLVNNVFKAIAVF